MKKFGLVLCSILLAGTAAFAETFRIPVGEFNELKVNDNINVVYSNNPDSVGFVVFETRNDYASYILTDMNKGKLKIELAQEAASVKMPTIYVYSSFLSTVENSKAGEVTVKDVKPTAKFTAEQQGNGAIIIENVDATTIDLKIITGKGKIIAKGKCTNLNIKNIGTGDIDAMELVAPKVKTNIMGTGSIYCNATKTLNISGLGSGKVYYHGNPIISKSKLGNIKPVPVVDEKITVTEEVTEEEVKATPLKEVTPDENEAVEQDNEEDDDNSRIKVTTA